MEERQAETLSVLRREAVLRRDSNGCYIECNNGMCKVMPTTGYYDKEDEVITAWNRRAKDDESGSD